VFGPALETLVAPFCREVSKDAFANPKALKTLALWLPGQPSAGLNGDGTRIPNEVVVNPQMFITYAPGAMKGDRKASLNTSVQTWGCGFE